MIEYTPAFSPRSRYLLRDEDEVAYFTRNGGAPEAGLITWARSLIKPDEVFIDVGAHVGTWAQDIAQHCVFAIAFEPQLEVYRRLEKGCELAYFLGMETSGDDEGIGRVITLRVGLGRAREPMTMHSVSVDGGGSTFRHRRELGEVIATEECLVLSLDAQNTPPPHPDGSFRIGLMKIDVEGGELDVLEGAKETIAQHKPHILAEAWLNPWYETERAKLWRRLESMGYIVATVTGWPEMIWARPT